MDNLNPARRLLKRLHPEGIPFPGTCLYNRLSASGLFQRMYALVARDIMAVSSQGSLLDIGTGPGWLLLVLQRLASVLQLTGLDTSPAMVSQARENIKDAGLSGAIEVHEGSASRLPFHEAAFDIIVSTGSLHHWKEPVAALDEIYRVLIPGGTALIYDVVSDTPPAVVRQAARDFGRLKILLFWLHAFEEPFYSRENLETLARSSLFETGEIYFVSVLCCLKLVRPA